MDKAREYALWQHNKMRVHNKAVEEAAWCAWRLRHEGRYVLVLTEKEILILRQALHEKQLTSAKLAIRDQLDGALDDEDSTGPIVDAILKLQVPWHSEEMDAVFTREYELLQKQYWPDFEKLTSDEEEELRGLRERIADLPIGQSVEDQEAGESIRMAAALLKKHEVIK